MLFALKIENTMESKNITSESNSFKDLYYVENDLNLDSLVIKCESIDIGEKIKIATLMKNHFNIGVDCAANCLNEIITIGAKPVHFSSSIVWEKRNNDIMENIKNGIESVCSATNTNFIDFKSSELQDSFKNGNYNLSGFAFGLCKKDALIDRQDIKGGDAIIGISSNGLHNLGYQSIIKTIRPSEVNINEYIGKFNNTLGEELIKPTKCYVNAIRELIKNIKVKAIININNGLLTSINKSLPKDSYIELDFESIEFQPIFEFLKGMVTTNYENMLNEYNMGVGMAIITSNDKALETISLLEAMGEKAYQIGEVI